MRSDGELTNVYRALIEAEESWREPLAKFKTPHDFVISAYRSLDFVPDDLRPITAFLTQAGQRPYAPGSPAGWPDTAANWNGGDALLKRIEFAAAAGRRIGDRIDPLTRAGEVLGALGEHTSDEHSRRRKRRARVRAAARLARVSKEIAMATRRSLLATGATLTLLAPFARLAAAADESRRAVSCSSSCAAASTASRPCRRTPSPRMRSCAARSHWRKPGSDGGVLDLDGTFGLHPALTNLHAMYRAREALVLHAAATPYRDRSHFEAQNVLEAGGVNPERRRPAAGSIARSQRSTLPATRATRSRSPTACRSCCAASSR